MRKIKKEVKPRDTWILDSWHYNGVGFSKNKKKILPRKNKHKKQFTNN